MPEPTVISLGCRLNATESEVMRRHAVAAGLGDAVLINTCAVTAEAISQARQTVRRLRREKPHARLIVTGCAAQIDPAQFAALPEVDHVIGNGDKLLPGTFVALKRPGSERVQVGDIMSAEAGAAWPPAVGFVSGARAHVQIQNGCNHRCTFCIIPYGRGPSRSVAAGEVVARVRRLVKAGCREVVLTGVDITSYGGDLAGEMPLGRLVGQILRQVPDLQRLRLSSIDQAEIDADLLEVLASEARLMPHLHVSMQSGDDIILKRMKRRHSRADAVRFCSEVRRARPEISFGADLIAGFPTETEAMFQRTLDVVDDCGLTFLHVFPFSPRPGTPAARMPQVPVGIVKDRAARLRQRGAAVLASVLSSRVGHQADVLMERGGVGRTEQFISIAIKGEMPPPEGSIVKARVTGHCGRRLEGEVVM